MYVDINAVIKISQILSANTVTTGANIALIMFVMSICFAILHIFPHKSNTLIRIISGLVAIIHRKNPILIKSTTVNAISGNNNPAATHTLITNSAIHFHIVQLPFDVSERFAKSISEL